MINKALNRAVGSHPSPNQIERELSTKSKSFEILAGVCAAKGWELVLDSSANLYRIWTKLGVSVEGGEDGFMNLSRVRDYLTDH